MSESGRRRWSRRKWLGDLAAAIVVMVVTLGAALGGVIAKETVSVPVSDTYILDELRLAEALMKRAFSERWAQVLADSSSNRMLRTDLLGDTSADYINRNRSCLRALDAFAVVESVASNIIQPNQNYPLYPREKEIDGLDTEWASYRAARRECERAVGASERPEVLPDRLSDAVKAIPPRIQRADTTPADAMHFSRSYPLDKMREREFRLHRAITLKSAEGASLVANDILADVGRRLVPPAPWPDTCDPLPVRLALAALLVGAIFEPSRAIYREPAKTRAEMDDAWEDYRLGREQCERDIGASPLKILPDRLSEAL